jgi:hypothetical protein
MFASGWFSMVVCRASRGELLRFASRGVLISQLQGIGVILELLEYPWWTVFLREDTVFANVLFIEASPFSSQPSLWSRFYGSDVELAHFNAVFNGHIHSFLVLTI